MAMTQMIKQIILVTSFASVLLAMPALASADTVTTENLVQGGSTTYAHGDSAYRFKGGTKTTVRDDDGNVIKETSTTNWEKTNSDGTKQTESNATEYDGEPFHGGRPAKATETVTTYGKDGKPTTSVQKDYDYDVDDKGVSWRSGAKKVNTTKFKDGKPTGSTTTDQWGKKQAETKYDKNGVKETSTTFRYDGTKESETDYDAKGNPTRDDHYGKKGKKIVRTKDYDADGGHTMTDYRDNMDVRVRTKFDKDGNAAKSELFLTSGGKVITIFKDGYPWKSIDYDKDGNEIGERYHKRSKPKKPKREDIARETGDSTGIFEASDELEGLSLVSSFDSQSMQAAVTDPPKDEQHNP
jgi:hypothetical protein